MCWRSSKHFGSFLFLALVGLSSTSLMAQTEEAPRFSVSSIKLSRPDAQMGDMRILISGPNLRVVNCTLDELLLNALQVSRRSEGGPSWVRERRFDISANSEDGTPPGKLTQMTLQLLRDRFKLAYRVESKETLGLALRVGTKQPNLYPSKDSERRDVTRGAPVTLKKVGMADFARVLSGLLNMPVVDRTGLAGQFDFILELNDDGEALAQRVRSAVEGIGFRFVDEKVRVEYVTIDHADLPGDN